MSLSLSHDDCMHASIQRVAAAYSDIIVRGALPYVSTMTIGFKTSFRTTLVDLQAAVLPFGKSRSFRNCVLMKLDPEVHGSNLTVKIFASGYLHFTGSKSLAVAEDAADGLLQAINIVFKQEAEVNFNKTK